MSPVATACLLAPFISGKNWDADEATAATGTHVPKHQKLLRSIPSHPKTGSRKLKKQGGNSPQPAVGLRSCLGVVSPLNAVSMGPRARPNGQSYRCAPAASEPCPDPAAGTLHRATARNSTAEHDWPWQGQLSRGCGQPRPHPAGCCWSRQRDRCPSHPPRRAGCCRGGKGAAGSCESPGRCFPPAPGERL